MPNDMLARMRMAQGAQISVSETSTGIELRPLQTEMEEQLAAAREVMNRRRAALAELAK